MNRKLTAHQSALGARAYSHNASRRAHQLSGPKRVRVTHGPVANPYISAALNEGIRSGRTDDKACKCGTLVCSYRGPCAPVVAEKPSARALDNLGGEPSPAGGLDQLIGTRWLVNGDGCHLRRGSVITVCSVITIDHAHNCAKVMCGSGLEWFVPARGDKRIGLALEREREPAPSPVSEDPAVESDEAVLKRCGWKPDGKGFLDFETADALAWIRLDRVMGEDGHRYCALAVASPTAVAPTLLQAACAALGIELCDACDGLWRAIYGDDLLVERSWERAEDCARAALEAWSRREPAQ